MTHPVLQGMLMTGCLKQQNILLAYHTYMELCEVKLLWDVDYSYEKELDLIYVKAKAKKHAENYDYYIPISASSVITPSWIKKVHDTIEPPNSSFILVIRDRDSTSVYYNVSNGLVPPLSPESAKQKKCLEEKQTFMWTELKKRKSELFDEAKAALMAERDSSVQNSVVDPSSDKTDDCSVQNSVVDLSSNKTNDCSVQNSVVDLSSNKTNDCSVQNNVIDLSSNKTNDCSVQNNVVDLSSNKTDDDDDDDDDVIIQDSSINSVSRANRRKSSNKTDFSSEPIEIIELF